jgi:cysteine sulfinate desulfinase/cysteine desulfurase-like protein
MSLGRFNTNEDVEVVLHELPGIVEKLRKISAFDPLP